MHIRLARAIDFPEIKDCEEQAFDLSARRGNTRDIAQGGVLAAQIQEGEIHVFQDASQIVGYISYSPSSDHVFVDSIAVLPMHHRKGVGSQLLSHAENAAVDLGLGSVKLFTDGMIQGNVQFYRRRGYLETDRCEDEGFSRIFYSKAVA